MVKIIFDGVEEITPETAMKWFCWHELVAAMERDRVSLDAAIKAVPHNVPDWEMRVLKKFVELSKSDLIV